VSRKFVETVRQPETSNVYAWTCQGGAWKEIEPPLPLSICNSTITFIAT